MPATNLQGLNIVHPVHESSDSHDLLLGQAYPDLTAQLDLWTNLAFDFAAQVQPTATAPSLAQLLALHPTHNILYNSGAPHYATPAPSSYSRTTAQGAEEPFVRAKRARTRKASVTSQESPEGREDSMPPTTFSPAEDKRRRNTAASARFRLKKKEREAVLEGKAKELETKVTELERECQGLRRENGWLKGLVVGVTGAAQGPNLNEGPTVSPPPPGSMSTGKKRHREEAV